LVAISLDRFLHVSFLLVVPLLVAGSLFVCECKADTLLTVQT